MPLPIAAVIALAAGSAAAGAGAGASRKSAAESAARTQQQTGYDIQQLGDEYLRAMQDMESGYQGTGEMGMANLQDLISSGRLYEQYGDYTGDLAFDPSSVDVTQDPGYAFRLAQGQAALDTGAGSQGQLFSGAQQKALMEYGQDLGSQEYQNAYNRQFTTFQDTRDAQYANYLNQLADYNQNLRNQYSDAMQMTGIGEASTARLGTAQGNYLTNQQYGTEMIGAGKQQEAAAGDLFKASLLQSLSGGLAGAAGAGGGGIGGIISSALGGSQSGTDSTGTTSTLAKQQTAYAPTNTVSGVAGTEGGTATASQMQGTGGNIEGTVGTGSDYTAMVPISAYMGGAGTGTTTQTTGYDPTAGYYGSQYGNYGQYGTRQPYYPQ